MEVSALPSVMCRSVPFVNYLTQLRTKPKCQYVVQQYINLSCISSVQLTMAAKTSPEEKQWADLHSRAKFLISSWTCDKALTDWSSAWGHPSATPIYGLDIWWEVRPGAPDLRMGSVEIISARGGWLNNRNLPSYSSWQGQRLLGLNEEDNSCLYPSFWPSLVFLACRRVTPISVFLFHMVFSLCTSSICSNFPIQ